MLQLRLVHREDGQTMAEYGVVLAVITALVFGSLTLLSTNVGAALTSPGSSASATANDLSHAPQVTNSA